mgnify:CR=1 FL=1
MVRNITYYGNWIKYNGEFIGNIQLTSDMLLILPNVAKKFKLKSDSYKLDDTPIINQIQEILKLK